MAKTGDRGLGAFLRWTKDDEHASKAKSNVNNQRVNRAAVMPEPVSMMPMAYMQPYSYPYAYPYGPTQQPQVIAKTKAPRTLLRCCSAT